MSLKIIFMGTPQFAAHILSDLINKSEHQIVAAYTKPPMISGRGMQLMPSPVQITAEAHQIPVFCPKTLKLQEEIDQFISLGADIAIVVAYGLILRQPILTGTKYGCINVHPSALPRWRGAAPIQRTIMAGDDKTAICIMQMDDGIDTGDIILEQEIQLNEEITAQELYHKVSELGAPMLLKTLSMISANQLQLRKQSEIGITYAHKLTKAEERIDWNQSAKSIHNKIRALSPRPGAHFIYNNEMIKIITSEYSQITDSYTPGTVIDDSLSIACADGILKPSLLQRQGKKMLYLDAFIRGFNIPKGTLLESLSL